MSNAVDKAAEMNRQHLAIDDSDEARIGRSIKPQPNGCWLHSGRADGYASIRTKAGVVSVHRWVYTTLVGPIDEGCHLHHTCGTKGCCNPAHLVQLTPKEHAAAHKVKLLTA